MLIEVAWTTHSKAEIITGSTHAKALYLLDTKSLLNLHKKSNPPNVVHCWALLVDTNIKLNA